MPVSLEKIKWNEKVPTFTYLSSLEKKQKGNRNNKRN